MTNPNSASPALKIMESRAELEDLLVDEPDDVNASPNFFPRSKTMRLLTSNRGMVLMAIVAGGLLILRPTLAKRAISMVPVNTMLRTVASRFFRRG